MNVRSRKHEDEYFARMEFEQRKRQDLERQELVGREERERQKVLHHMKCPKCGMGLAEIDYLGLKVDKCTGCDGIWLDPGELEAVARLGRSAFDKLFAVFRR